MTETASASLERIHHPDSTVVLAMIQVLGKQLTRTAGSGRRQNHGVPKRELPTKLEREAQPKNGECIVDDKPMGKIRDKSGSLFCGMPLADEIEVEFLQHLHADTGATKLNPRLLDEGLGNEALCRGVEIVAVKQNIRIQKALSGHGFDRE